MEEISKKSYINVWKMMAFAPLEMKQLFVIPYRIRN
jgi:hypothetical protein